MMSSRQLSVELPVTVIVSRAVMGGEAPDADGLSEWAVLAPGDVLEI